MEHLKPEELDIPREDREAELCINGIAHVFSTGNTATWRYPSRYAMLDHVTQEGEHGYRMWFGFSEEDYQKLEEIGVTQIRPPYPSDKLIADFWEVEMTDYDREIDEMDRGGETAI